MAKHGIFKERLIKTINQFFPCEELDTGNPDMKFSIIIRPFKGSFCSFLIEKLKKVDYMRLVCIISITTKIQDIIKELPEDTTQTVISQFDNLYRIQFKTDYMFSEGYKSI